mgnify:CR=1 FL=1
MNPYNINIKKLKVSKSLKDQPISFKMNLVISFLKIIQNMQSDEVMELTKLDKADLCRLRGLAIERFTVDRIINLIDALGYSTQVKVVAKKPA